MKTQDNTSCSHCSMHTDSPCVCGNSYSALENKALELLEENVNYDEAELGCNWGMEELKDFLKSHLQLAYQSGVDKTIERFATGDFIRGEEAEKFRQQAIKEERERLSKWAEENWEVLPEINRILPEDQVNTEPSYFIRASELLQELQNK